MANLPLAELPQGNNTIWQAFPPEEIPWQNFHLYGKSPPTQIPYVILGQHVRFVLGEGGGGGRNPIDGELLPYGILSGGRKSMGGGGRGEEIPCDTGFALFWQHDAYPNKTSIPYNYNVSG